MKKIVNLQVVMEIRGDTELAIEEMRKDIIDNDCSHCVLCGNKAFSYQVVSAEIIK